MNTTLRTWFVWSLLLSISQAVCGGVYLVENGIPVDNSIVIAWDPSPDSSVMGYNLYFGTVSGSYTDFINVSNLTCVTLAGFVPGTSYYLTVTAYDAFGSESLPSNEARYDAPWGRLHN